MIDRFKLDAAINSMLPGISLEDPYIEDARMFLRSYSWEKLENITNKSVAESLNCPWSQAVQVVSILESYGFFDKHWLFISDGKEVEIDQEDVVEAIKKDFFLDPVSGDPVEDFKRKIFSYSSPSTDFTKEFID